MADYEWGKVKRIYLNSRKYERQFRVIFVLMFTKEYFVQCRFMKKSKIYLWQHFRNTLVFFTNHRQH